ETLRQEIPVQRLPRKVISTGDLCLLQIANDLGESLLQDTSYALARKRSTKPTVQILGELEQRADQIMGTQDWVASRIYEPVVDVVKRRHSRFMSKYSKPKEGLAKRSWKNHKRA